MLKHKCNQKNTGDVLNGTSPVSNKKKWTAIIEKALSFVSRRKVFFIVIAVLLVLSIPRQFIAIHLPIWNEAHEIGSVAFDRWDMNRVNRVEIKFNEETIETIFDRRFIRRLTSQTMVARQANFNTSFGRFTISLYRDYDIVRVMDLCVASERLIRVYRPSSVHRFFATGDFRIDCLCCGGGLVTMRNRLAEEIWQIILTSPYTAHLFYLN